MLLNFTQFHSILLNFTQCYSILLNFTQCYSISLYIFQVSPQKEELDVDEDENWPPWVTAKPEDSNDIVMVDEQQKPQVSSNSNSQNTPISRPSFNSASGLRLNNRTSYYWPLYSLHLKMLLISFVVRYFFVVDVL